MSVHALQLSLTALYYIIEGQGAIRVMDEQGRLQAGSLPTAPAGLAGSMPGDTPTRALAVQVP